MFRSALANLDPYMSPVPYDAHLQKMFQRLVGTKSPQKIAAPDFAGTGPLVATQLALVAAFRQQHCALVMATLLTRVRFTGPCFCNPCICRWPPWRPGALPRNYGLPVSIGSILVCHRVKLWLPSCPHSAARVFSIPPPRQTHSRLCFHRIRAGLRKVFGPTLILIGCPG